MIGRKKSVGLATMALSLSLLLNACGNIGEAADPALWGYTAAVTYHAMGGIINQREVRQTSYMPNSLIFKPSGTTNMLVEPTKQGMTLAGWYTNYTESVDEEGNTVYEFDAQDRWDFNVDRVRDEMTLYARWVDVARGQYIDPETGEVVFEKNLTASSPLQALSGAVSGLIAKPGFTLTGYYADPELTEEYDFSTYEYRNLLPTDIELYAQLAEEFPENFLPYVPSDDEPEVSEAIVDGEEIVDGEGEVAPDTEINEEDDLVFLRSLGYDLQADEAEVAEIRSRKNEIIEEYIDAYVENNENTTVYLQYSQGNTVLIRSAEDLKTGSDYGFFDTDGGKTYKLENDIDLSGISMKNPAVFTGVLDGQGYTISNLKLTISTSKIDFVTEKDGSLFGNLDGAEISNVTFKDMVIVVNVPNTVNIRVAALAIDAINSKIDNVVFDGLTIQTGRGDDGTSTYVVSDSILNNQGSEINGLAGANVVIEASPNATVTETLEPLK